MNVDSSSNNANNKINKIIPLNQLVTENDTNALDLEQMGEYIKKNIRGIVADKDTEYFELPALVDDTIEEAFIYKTFENDKQAIRFAMKAFDKDPIAITIAEGNYESICSKVDHQDFTKNFVQRANRSKKYFMY